MEYICVYLHLRTVLYLDQMFIGSVARKSRKYVLVLTQGWPMNMHLLQLSQ
jgi:hypothetical protein